MDISQWLYYIFVWISIGIFEHVLYHSHGPFCHLETWPSFWPFLHEIRTFLLFLRFPEIVCLHYVYKPTWFSLMLHTAMENNFSFLMKVRKELRKLCPLYCVYFCFVYPALFFNCLDFFIIYLKVLKSAFYCTTKYKYFPSISTFNFLFFISIYIT
jgi:hypothetical protein